LCSGVAGLVDAPADGGVVERGTDDAGELRVEVYLDRFDATDCAQSSASPEPPT
jgi:hypothetical protein